MDKGKLEGIGGLIGKLFPAGESVIKFNNNTRGANGNAGKNITMNGNNSQLQASASASAFARINLTSIVVYLAVISIIILLFLIFVDRFITPVFKFSPGQPGYIPVPYGDDGVLYWQKTPGSIRDDSTILSNIASGYTLSLDVYIYNPMAFAKTPRVIFWRGSPVLTKASNSMETSRISEFNLLYSLAPDTNDLLVETMIETPGKPQKDRVSVKVNNVPIRKGFRITTVLFDRLMEVYLNGKLYQTRTLPNQPLGSFHFFNPQTIEGQACTAVRNLKIWNRCLSAAEIRDMSPPINPFADFENTMPATCSSAIDSVQSLVGLKV